MFRQNKSSGKFLLILLFSSFMESWRNFFKEKLFIICRQFLSRYELFLFFIDNFFLIIQAKPFMSKKKIAYVGKKRTFTLFFFCFVEIKKQQRAKTPLAKTKVGGQTPFSTIRYLEVRKKNMENLFLPKVLYVIKDCLKNLARAKSALRARNLKKSIFGAMDLYPPPKYPPTS